MRGRRLVRLAVIALLLQPLVTPSARGQDDADRTIGVLYRGKRSYETAANAIAAHLRAQGRECVLIELPARSDKEGREDVKRKLIDLGPGVIATGGTSATAFALEAVPDVPVVFFLVPNARDAPFLAEGFKHRSRLAGVTSDVSSAGRIDWAGTTYPNLSSIAVLHSKATTATVANLKTAASAKGIQCVPILANREAFPEAIEALNESGCDGLLPGVTRTLSVYRY